jgi:hypothetical protein
MRSKAEIYSAPKVARQAQSNETEHQALNTADEKPISVSGDRISKNGVWDSFKRIASNLSGYNGPGNASMQLQDPGVPEYSDWLFEYDTTGISPKKDQAITRIGVEHLSGGGGYRIRARLDESSTSDNPILMIEAIEPGKSKVYLVEINKVNASDASFIEGFAMLADRFSGNDEYETISDALFGFGMMVEPIGTNGIRTERFSLDTRINFVDIEPEKTAAIEIETKVIDDVLLSQIRKLEVGGDLADVASAVVGDAVSNAMLNNNNAAKMLRSYENNMDAGEKDGETARQEETRSESGEPFHVYV